jgi:hypothetical protein
LLLTKRAGFDIFSSKKMKGKRIHPRRTMVLALAGALIAGCASVPKGYYEYERKELMVIHEKIGERVDAEEAEKYGLFPGFEGFVHAQFYSVGGGGFEIEIRTENAEYIALNRDSLAPEILHDYIENYEVYGDSIALFRGKWKVMDFDELGIAITEREVKINQGEYFVPIGVGCGCVGSSISFPLALYYAGCDVFGDGECEKPVKGWLTFIGGTAVSIAAGTLMAREFDRKKALVSIRKAREPVKKVRE